ncbi:hypothetical protein XELAEV_18018710mg [Xenopus laevis]|uniref:G-protein coupled receptors family 1 profile domain-containing protein n=1 Tax=Xenopus laevis TaxID=8355 RepID=A0A974HTU3_XENLA|nr:hypothetical protein XELAEV_18018710mg [Xenopus laevis]
MYLLLANLSFVDISYTTTVLPKLLHILLTGKNIISFSNKIVLLPFMAYDRYVAVCDPLKYHFVINIKKCALILLGFCGSNTINQFFCDIKYVAKISLCIKSATGRKKTFSTCSSHLTVLLLFYGVAS